MKNFLEIKFQYLFISISLLGQFRTISAGFGAEQNICTTPSGAKGHCGPIRLCAHPELKENHRKVFEYRCYFKVRYSFILAYIEKERIGVCCPDNRVKPTTSKEQVLSGRYNKLPGSLVGNELEPRNRECGITTKKGPIKLGLRLAKPNQWPWMAAIMRLGETIAHCGGVLVTDQHVLTAAHCVYRVKLTDFYVRLGEHDFRELNETRIHDFQILWIRTHTNYRLNKFPNDIAMVKLDRPTVYYTNIRPACKPPIGKSWIGRTGIVTGWGSMFEDGPRSSVLKEIAVPILKQKRCKKAYGLRIDDKVLCAGPENGGYDSCQGDSGGPLLVQLKSKRWVVVGIVSWGLGCGLKNHPGVYTRVDKYMSWIMENLKY